MTEPDESESGSARVLPATEFDFPALIAIADTLPVMVAYCDRHERYLFVNRPLADWFERPRDEILGRRIEDVMGEGPYALRMNAIAAAIGGEAQVVEAEFRHHSRGLLFTRATYRPHRDRNGEVVGLVMIVENITEHRRSEIDLRARIAEGSEELADSDARFRAVFDSLDMVGLVSLDGTLIDVNESVLDRLDAEKSEIVGKSLVELAFVRSIPISRSRLVEMMDRAKAGHEVSAELEIETNGKPGVHMVSVRPVIGREGAPRFLIVEARDVSELKVAQDQLRQAQKMEALGQLTGGIAHDFNNLLTVVVGGLDMITRREVDEKTRNYATNALAAAERGARLTGQLLAFSRTQKLEIRPSDVGELIRQSKPLLRNVLKPGIERHLEIESGLLPVMADPTQLEVALLNLAVNARDAMPDGGELAISARSVAIEADPELADGSYVEIAVSDTGEGMDDETKARVFEPFFTTKEIGKGTGLGLSMVYGMARQSGGTARVDSVHGKGTTVRILLRQAEAPAQVEASHGKVPSKVHHDGDTSVLVVDDDEAVRAFMVETLSARGYAVTEAENARRALRQFSEIEPDIVVLDYVMPGMSGADVAARMLDRRPDQPILFVSGYSETEAIRRVAPNAALLAKPFRGDMLEEAVRKLVASE